MTTDDVLTRDFAEQFPAEFAATLSAGTTEEALEVLDSLPERLVIPVAARLSQRLFMEVSALDPNRLRGWLVAAEIDHALMFVGRLRQHQAVALIQGVEDPKLNRRLMQVVRYPDHCVGAVMGSKLVQIDGSLPLAQLLQDLRGTRAVGDPAVVVLDERGRYIGKLDPWKALLRAAAGDRVGEYVQRVEPLLPEMTIVSARQVPQWEMHSWLPVADQNGRVLGSVSRSALVQADAAPEDLLITGVADAGGMMVHVFAELLERLLVRRSSP